jgi:iron(III) transport system ATP-binding protein
VVSEPIPGAGGDAVSEAAGHAVGRRGALVPGGGSAPVVEARGLVKRFGAVAAVDGVDLDVHPGEVLALLGPSGCGKTTTLRLIAGFERPDAGRVVLNGEEVAGPRQFVPAERRRVGVTFQDYALFPHLTVARNVGYGVRDRARRRERVAAMLELVGLADAGDRLPHQLSGGQQQRVALARALAPEPTLVLLDEPFSNLDAALRADVRADVRAILSDAKATAVVVTHDQEEALSLADRVAVMRDGRILQIDTPLDVYSQPDERFVATFVGDADVVPGHADDGRVVTAIGALPLASPLPAGAVDVVVRPERVRLRLDSGGEGVVAEITFFGHDQLVGVRLGDGTRVRSRMGPGRAFEPGDRVSVSVTGDVIAYPRA